MQTSPTVVTRPGPELTQFDRTTNLTEMPVRNEANSAGISWAAVVGGAFVAAAVSLILVTLGTGLGFSAISPWVNPSGASPTSGAAAIAWLIISQVIAFAFGGYVAGRLRTKWVEVHSDEVFFRDTANGLLVWASGFVVVTAFLASTLASLSSPGNLPSLAGATGTTGEPRQYSALLPSNYFVDSLFRASGPVPNGSVINGSITSGNANHEGRDEAFTIFSHALLQGSLSEADRSYLAQIVSARTGLTQPEAEGRVTELFAQAQQSAESARKKIGHFSLWLFVALLCGAFSASYAGTIGGRQRDHVPVI